MPVGPYSEKNIIRTFINNDENTMQEVVSKSVGMAILLLQGNYASEVTTEEGVQKLYDRCINILDKITEPSLKAAVEHLKAIVNQETTVLDRVTLYIRNEKDVIEDIDQLFSEKLDQQQSSNQKEYQEITYLFPVKEVLALVWRALNDNTKYVHNYSGNHQEKLKLAQKDKPFRYITFYNCLKRMHTEKICHQGNRNELVFTLNKLYEGVDLIEDKLATVMQFLKDKISEKFWGIYKRNKNAAKKKELTEALYLWVSENNATGILAAIDPKNKIISELKELFIRNGSNPNEAIPDTFIEGALQSLEFTCDPKEYPNLLLMHNVLAEIESPETLVLKKAKQWVKENFSIETARAENKNLASFLSLYQNHRAMQQNRTLLLIGGEIDKLNILLALCKDYFEAIATTGTFPVIPDATVSAVSALNETIKHLKQDNFFAKIQDFFNLMYDPEVQVNEKRALYAMLLEENIRQKIILTDEMIEDFSRRGVTTEAGISYRDLIPYEINRIFLHAILTQPDRWTPLFGDTFRAVWTFIKNYQSEEEGLAEELIYYSYRDPSLRNQLDYLLEQYDAINLPNAQRYMERPNYMLILPEQMQTITDWTGICELVDKDKLRSIYQRLSSVIHPILRSHCVSIQEASWYTIKEVLDSLPLSGVANFMNFMLQHEEYDYNLPKYLIKWLHTYKLEEDGIDEFQSIVDIERYNILLGIIKEKIKNHVNEFFADKDNEIFSTSLSPNLLSELSRFIDMLPENERHSFCEMLTPKVREELEYWQARAAEIAAEQLRTYVSSQRFADRYLLNRDFRATLETDSDDEVPDLTSDEDENVFLAWDRESSSRSNSYTPRMFQQTPSTWTLRLNVWQENSTERGLLSQGVTHYKCYVNNNSRAIIQTIELCKFDNEDVGLQLNFSLNCNINLIHSVLVDYIDTDNPNIRFFSTEENKSLFLRGRDFQIFNIFTNIERFIYHIDQIDYYERPPLVAIFNDFRATLFPPDDPGENYSPRRPGFDEVD